MVNWFDIFIDRGVKVSAIHHSGLRRVHLKKIRIVPRTELALTFHEVV